jgi:hypothetical protein
MNDKPFSPANGPFFHKAKGELVPVGCAITDPTEFAVKAMRDSIYQVPCKNWSACKDHWLKDEKWLTEQYAKLKPNTTLAPEPF